MNKTIAIITARGGSKRIPKKNIKDFCGKPILQYSIEAALESGIFSEVMVSTDDEEIAKIAKEAGANVPFMRSEKTSNDYATTADVLLEVLEKYREMGQEFDYTCCIYPTAPFVTKEKLQKAFAMMKENRAFQLTPVVAYSFPPQRCVVIRDGKIEMLHPEHRNTRSQDLEPYYHDCGQFYFYDTKELIKRNGVIVEHVIPMVLSELEVQDIDNESDWTLAEIKYKMMKNTKDLM